MNNDFKNYLLVIFWFIVIPVTLFVLASSYITTIFPNSQWAYALKYSTASEYVTIERQPHDCEFDKAPMGNKYCHFESVVTTRAGDGAVKNSTQVFVTWEKVPE